jgi:pyridoxine kinase
MIENFVYEAGRGTLLKEKKVGGDRSGSGDAFAAIVAASLVRGASLTDAVKKAADFISKCLAYAVALDLPWNYGLPFEEYLTEQATCTNVHFVDIVHRPYSKSNQSRCACGLRSWGFT